MKLLQILKSPKMLTALVLGFSSGMPLLLTAGTLQAWFRDSGLNLAEIGLFSLVALPYTVKFLWSPLLDYLVPPFLGRRRGWLTITQCVLALSLVGLGLTNPAQHIWITLIFAFMVAFWSATQDIAVDAFIIELFPAESYAIGNQTYIIGYRIGMIVGGGLSLVLADQLSWGWMYLIMALLMSLGLAATLLSPEPVRVSVPIKNLKEAIYKPIQDFFSASGSLKGKALWILAFFLLYNICGNLATALTTNFYQDLHFTKTEIGLTSKVFGVWATIIGGVIGASIVVSIGVRRALWIFGVMQGLASLAFAWLDYYVTSLGATSIPALATAITIENLTIGLATAAYTTFMGMTVNKQFTATQYALLSSLMAWTRVLAPPIAGVAVHELGWFTYYILCTFTAIPGLLILSKLDRMKA